MADLTPEEKCLSSKAKKKKSKRKHSTESSEDMTVKHFNKNTDHKHTTRVLSKTVEALTKSDDVNMTVNFKKKLKNKKNKKNESDCIEPKEESNRLSLMKSDDNSMIDNIHVDCKEVQHVSKKKKKSKKKHCEVDEGVNSCLLLESKREDMHNGGGNVHNKTEKKYKKTISEPLENCESDKSAKKKKPRKHKECLENVTDQFVEFSNDMVVQVDDEENGGSSHHSKRKKKKKKREKNGENEAKMAESPSDEVAQHDFENGKNRKKRKNKMAEQDFAASDSTDQIEPIQNGEQNERKTKTKKSKKRKHDRDNQNRDQDGNHVAESLVTMDSEEMSKLQTGSKGVGKKMKKAKKFVDCENSSTDFIVQTTDDNFTGHKRSKKRKRKDLIVTDEDDKACDILENSTGHKKTKKKKTDLITTGKDEKSCDICENSKSETVSNISHGYSGVATSITSTGKSQNDESVANSFNNLGQWGTASLGSNDRQQKFLRLLGGFKKGDNCSSKSIFGNLGARTKGGQLALNHQQEESLTKNLMDNFQKALDYKLYKDKGVGLGFAPPPGEGKKFYIDTNVTKSHKFDD